MPDASPEGPILSRVLGWQESSVRLVILLATLLLIIALAFVIRLRVTSSTVESVERVAHTHEVKAAVFELASALNEMEAAAFAAQYDPLSEFAANRYGKARALYEPLLSELRDLTLDNPSQQERAGMLRAEVCGALDEAAAASFMQAMPPEDQWLGIDRYLTRRRESGAAG